MVVSDSVKRMMRKFFWLVVAHFSGSIAKALRFLARYTLFLKKVVRKTLAYPLQTISSHAMAKVHEISAPKHIDIAVVEVLTEGAEGVELTGTLYMPFSECDKSELGFHFTDEHETVGTVLIRTPYHRHNLGPAWARLFAERGFAVLIQDTRGRFGSGGDFFPVKHEVADGGATIDWIRKQPWSNGKVSLFGVSYLGLTTYAAAGSKAGKHVSSIVPIMSSSKTYPLLFHSGSGSLALDLVLRWLWLAVKLMHSVEIYKFCIPFFQHELNSSFMDAPLCNQDEKLIGKKLGFLQEAIRATDEKHDFWSDKNVLCDLTHPEAPPTHIVGGWYDFFVKQTFNDFNDASKRGNSCTLTVGKWHHWQFQSYGTTAIKVALDMFEKHMNVDKDLEENEDQSGVTVAFLNSKPTLWAKFSAWPPLVSNLCGWKLAKMQRKKSQKNKFYSQYIYDPENPTPYVGGPSFDIHNNGRMEQSSLEIRDDVVTFTSKPMKQGLYVAGDVYVDLHATTSNPYTDFFVKICDVNCSTGESYNLVEGLVRMTPEQFDKVLTITDENGEESTWHVVEHFKLKVGPVAQMFKPNHAIRVMIAGGAHPLYMRNLGCGHDIATAVETRKAVHRIHHDTTLLLPVVDQADIQTHKTEHPAVAL